MNFASKFVNCDYLSDEDDIELSSSEIEEGFDTLDFGRVDSDSGYDSPDYASDVEIAPVVNYSPAVSDDEAQCSGPQQSAAPKPMRQISDKLGAIAHSVGNMFHSSGPSSSSSNQIQAQSNQMNVIMEDQQELPPLPAAAPGAPESDQSGPKARRGGRPSSAGRSAPRAKKRRTSVEMLNDRAVRQDKRSEKSAARKVLPTKKRHRQRINTNVVSISLGSLSTGADQLQTGDPEFCQNPHCRCIFSAESKNELKVRPKITSLNCHRTLKKMLRRNYSSFFASIFPAQCVSLARSPADYI
eukprot:630506_1